MSLRERNDIFFPDQPLKNPEDDLLGYGPLAEEVAKSIIDGAFPGGFTIAIQGPWGSGKSTMLNFIRHYLEKPGQNAPIIVQFNPWWFSRSGEEILLSFFKQLSAAIGKDDKNKDTARRVLKIGLSLLQCAPIPYLQMISKGVENFVEEALKAPVDIFELRDKVSNDLKGLGRKVVVFVDDIDRLHPEEMKQLFMIIRAITDFPNTIYLLAFDRKVVASSIGDNNKEMPGENYLQKIVQVPVDLPIIDEEHLLKSLSKGLEGIFVDTDQLLRDDSCLEYVLSHLIGENGPVRTLRDVCRLLNRLYLTYPIAKGNVVLSDFVTIEALSIFYPKIYEAIRNHRKRFIGYGQLDAKEDKKFYDTLLEGETKTVRKLLEFLFPRVGGSDHIEIARKNSFKYQQSRICGEAFPFYFCLTATNWISNKEIEEILSTKKADQIKDKLLEKEAHKIILFLVRLEKLVLEVPSEPRELWPLIECLVKFGDDLVTKTKETELAYTDLYAGSADLALLKTVVNSLKRLRDQPGYPDGVVRLFETSESLSTIVGIVAVMEKWYRKVFPEKESEIFKAKVLDKLSKGSTRILGRPLLSMVLKYWHRWDKESFDAWCKEVIENLEKYDRTKVLRLRKAFNAIIEEDDEITDEEKSAFEAYAKELESAMRRLGMLDTQKPENGEKNQGA